MRTFQASMYSTTELWDMIESLEGMNDEDVKELYGLDTVEEAEEMLTEACEGDENYGTCYQTNGFNGAYDYNSYRF